jgi:hypothetical protein
MSMAININNGNNQWRIENNNNNENNGINNNEMK